MRKEVFVSPLEDVEFGVEEFGVVVHGAISLPDEAAHSRATFWWELAVEDDHDSLFWAWWNNWGLEKEVLHLVFLVQVQSSLAQQTGQSRRWLLRIYVYLTRIWKRRQRPRPRPRQRPPEREKKKVSGTTCPWNLFSPLYWKYLHHLDARLIQNQHQKVE